MTNQLQRGIAIHQQLEKIMQSGAKFLRKGHIILNVETGEEKHFDFHCRVTGKKGPSKSAAKREVRKMGLRPGELRVVENF